MNNRWTKILIAIVLVGSFIVHFVHAYRFWMVDSLDTAKLIFNVTVGAFLSTVMIIAIPAAYGGMVYLIRKRFPSTTFNWLLIAYALLVFASLLVYDHIRWVEYLKANAG